MDYLDWARLDLAAAVDAVPQDGLPLVMVGHSYGGHAFGLRPTKEPITRWPSLAETWMRRMGFLPR